MQLNNSPAEHLVSRQSIMSTNSSSDASRVLSSPNASYFSETSSEDSPIWYKDKLENLQTLVQQLTRQIQSERLRTQGLGTVKQRLEELRQDNNSLQTVNKKQEQIIRILENRLSDNGLPVSVPDRSDSSGFSFETPNTHKHALKSMFSDSQSMDNPGHSGMPVDNGLQDVHRPSDLFSNAPDQSKEFCCHSLFEESHTLQKQLHKTSEMCQQLLKKLERHESPGSKMEELASGSNQPLLSSFVKLDLNCADMESLKAEYKNLHERMSTLRLQLQEVVGVNERWQEYHEKRESEFSQVQRRLEDAERQLQRAPCSLQLSEQQQEQIDKLVLQYKRQIETTDSEREKVMDENRQLRIDLDQQVSVNKQLESQITELLGQLRNKQSPVVTANDDKERIHALEMQVKLYSEDFASERSDRERAHAQIGRLKQEIQLYKAQLEAVQRSSVSRVQRRRHQPQLQCDDDNGFNIDDVPMPEPSEPPMQLIGRGLLQYDNMEDEGEDMVDLGPNNLDRQTNSTHKHIVDVIQCPQCQTEFPKHLHCQLLEHMDTCLK